MDKKVFSAVIITYNQKDFIAQTLDSILSQKHSYSYEIIVGDDASTDGTQAVLEDYKEKYPDIITLILNEKNLGIVGNYYKTLANASGKYIMECAGDDYWLPGKVEKQIGFMESRPDYGMCFTNVYDLIDGKLVLENPDRYTDFESFITKGGVVPGPTPCYRRSLFLDYMDDVRPLEKNWLMEDCPLWLWFTKNTKVKYFPEALAVYRLFRDSACHSSDIEKQKKFVDSLCDVHNFFARKYDFPLQKNLGDMFLGNYLSIKAGMTLHFPNSSDLKMIRLLFKELKSPTAKQKMFYIFSYIPPLYMFVYVYRKVKKMLKK